MTTEVMVTHNRDIPRLILENVKTHPKLKHLLENVPASQLDIDPWKSNFAAVKYSDDPVFCDRIAMFLNEEKKPLFVAIMRSVDDPEKKIGAFHDVHIDSRKSNKTLMVLQGDPTYSVFSQSHLSNFSLAEKIYLRGLALFLSVIEIMKLRPLQGKFSHKLPESIKRKVYANASEKGKVTGKAIKFDNMMPHHSHPLPTKYSILLQVVYD